jgi:hypothetical protein
MTNWTNRRDDWEIFNYEAMVRETPKAYLLKIQDQELWLPKSQSEILDDEVVQLSPWIAKEKGLL